jgi:hypothetical protein
LEAEGSGGAPRETSGSRAQLSLAPGRQEHSSIFYMQRTALPSSAFFISGFPGACALTRE